VATARWISLAGLAAALCVLLGVLTFGPRMIGRGDDKAIRIRKRYGHWLVPVDRVPEPLESKLVEVGDIKTLVRLAERYDRMILHESRDGAHTFCVAEDGVLYRYGIGTRLPPAPPVPRPPSAPAARVPSASVSSVPPAESVPSASVSSVPEPVPEPVPAPGPASQPPVPPSSAPPPDPPATPVRPVPPESSRPVPVPFFETIRFAWQSSSLKPLKPARPTKTRKPEAASEDPEAEQADEET